jgi:hypothetical protein
MFLQYYYYYDYYYYFSVFFLYASTLTLMIYSFLRLIVEFFDTDIINFTFINTCPLTCLTRNYLYYLSVNIFTYFNASILEP